MKETPEPLLRNLRAFVGFARKRLGDPALAEDAVQESLLKALRAARAPERDEELVTWFYRILRRSIIDLHRRRAARQRAMERLEAEIGIEPTRTDQKMVCRCFVRLLPDLQPTHREVLERIDLGGATVPEVAKALGLSPNLVHVRLHRARRRLRDELVKTCRVCSRHGCLDCTC